MLHRISLLFLTTTLLAQQPVHSAAFVSGMASRIGSGVSSVFSIANLDPHIKVLKAMCLLTIGLPTTYIGTVGMCNIYTRLCTKFYQYQLNRKMIEHAQLSDPATLKKEVDARNAELNHVPGGPDLAHDDQNRHEDLRSQIQAKIDANLIEQNRLQALIQKHQDRQTYFNIEKHSENALLLLKELSSAMHNHQKAR